MDATSTPTSEAIVESLEMTQLSEDTPSRSDSPPTLPRASTLPSMGALSAFKRGSRNSLSFKQIATLARQDSVESKLEQLLISSLPSDLQVQVRASTNVRDSLIQAVKNGQVQQSNEQLIASLQELGGNVMEIKSMASTITDLVGKNNEQGYRIIALVSENQDQLAEISQLQKDLASKQDEMKQLQIQALDRLALLQKSVHALLTQTYELHEYPIPRLFIVLPRDTSSWNPLDLLSNKFRLYFLCECGEHTKSTNTKIPHHIHLAKHEGYDIDRPNEFFQRYGSYILTILQMLKYGINVAGLAIPALSHLIRPDAMGQVTEGLTSLTNNLEPGMNQVMDYIEKASAEDGQAVIGLSEQLDSNEALEGADLRQLESFLKIKDESRALGNLYRTVTSEGYVKWVCIDHFRENYQEKAAKLFREAVNTLQGIFDENVGRVEVKLHSKVQAEQFYQALGSARSVYELKLHLDWDTTQGDFKRLQNALAKSSVGVLDLDVGDRGGPASDILNRSQRYEPVVGIMRHPSIQSFAIRGPRNLSKLSSLLSRHDDFSNLRHLDIPLYPWKNDIPGFKHLIANTPNLSSLALGTGYLETGNGYVLGAYKAIAAHHTYPILFKDLNLVIPPLPRETNQPIMTAQQNIERLVKVFCDNQKLNIGELDESTVDTIAQVTTNGFAFTRFELSQKGILSDSFVNNLSSTVSRSELHAIKIWMREDSERVRILESIQWKHLCELYIKLKRGTFETSVMRILVDGVTKMSEKVELESFVFEPESWFPLTLPEGDLLQTFVASTSIENLHLSVAMMTLEQILSLCRSTDVSRLESLKLCTGGFDSVKVDAILGGLQHAMKLKKLHLFGAYITDEQKSQMNAKGVSLTDLWNDL